MKPELTGVLVPNQVFYTYVTKISPENFPSITAVTKKDRVQLGMRFSVEIFFKNIYT